MLRRLIIEYLLYSVIIQFEEENIMDDEGIVNLIQTNKEGYVQAAKEITAYLVFGE